MLFRSDPFSARLWRLTWALLFLCSVGLLASSVYRAATFPFTHDESLSFAIFSWDPNLRETANNHFLNTLLMQWCSTLFGQSELSLRLPNILAHLIYLACTLSLLARFRHVALLMAGFAMLNLNSFLLDFFFLARGYGLALAFMMLSLCLLARAYEKKQQEGFIKYVHLSVLAGSLAVLANLAFLNYHLPLLLASAWLLLSDASLRRFSRGHVPAAIALFAVSGIFLKIVLSTAFRLQEHKALYFGGHTGFITDTVGSLVRCSLYAVSGSQTTENAISAILVGTLVLLLPLGLYIFFLRKESPPLVVFSLLMASAAALPIVQHRLFRTLFPIERGALYYLPLGAVALLFALDWLAGVSRRRWEQLAVLAPPAAMAAILGWHFYQNFDTQCCYSWGYDRHNDEVLATIDLDRRQNSPGQTISLGNSWKLEPSLNFYRITHRYGWLAPATRKPITDAGYNYIYAFESEVNESLAGQSCKLLSYPDTQTVLLRLNSAHGRPALPEGRKAEKGAELRLR